MQWRPRRPKLEVDGNADGDLGPVLSDFCCCSAGAALSTGSASQRAGRARSRAAAGSDMATS